MDSPEVLLGRAARLVRTTAEKAAEVRPEPWTAAVKRRVSGSRDTVVRDPSGLHVCGFVRPAVADHVALWDPNVAKAVAALLQEAAEDCGCYVSAGDDADIETEALHIWRFAIALAAAVRDSYVPRAHYAHQDGTACCVHAVPAGPGSCLDCWELQ